MEKVLYHTTIVSGRHEKHGYCEDGDFSKIILTRATEEDAPLICNIKDFQLNQTLRLFKGYYYGDFDRWNHTFYFKDKQGRLTDKTAIALMVELRKKETTYYPTRGKHYLIVGKRIYVRWCKKSELKITQTGNTMFGDWWTMDIESATGLSFTKKNFNKELDKTKRWVEKKNKGRKKKIHFSYPRIKWFKPE